MAFHALVTNIYFTSACSAAFRNILCVCAFGVGVGGMHLIKIVLNMMFFKQQRQKVIQFVSSMSFSSTLFVHLCMKTHTQ